MAGTTSPDNIPYLTLTDNVIDTGYTAGLATAVQNALNGRALHAYRWANAAERTAQTGMVAGDTGYQVDTAVWYLFTASGAWKQWQSDWQSYNATRTGFNIGNGTASTSWKYASGRVKVRFNFIFGTTGNTFPSQPEFSLPVPMRAARWPNEIITNCALLDFGAASTLAGLLSYSGANPDRIRIAYSAVVGGLLSAASILPSAPWTWAPGDGMAGEFEYDPA